MRFISAILVLSSLNTFSAELFCDLGKYNLIIETDLETCMSGKPTMVKLLNGNSVEASFEANCELQNSTQYVTKNMMMYKDLFFEMELTSSYSNNSVLITNDQTIGFNKGISTIDFGEGSLGEIDFNFMKDCNYTDFMKSFLNLPDQPQQ